MQCYSTNNPALRTQLRDAVLGGLAPDGGLWMPVHLPRLSRDFFDSLRGQSFQEISYRVAKELLPSDVPENVLEEIVVQALNFSIPLVPLHNGVQVLELFHGPTLAFKDVGARFMARLMSHFVEGGDRELVVLVATSGDTGSAVAHGFFGVPGIRVVILYPSGKVSHAQEQMLTTMGGNIMALEVQGTFDDCQRLVKEAFVDKELPTRLWITSANSINIARLIPQMFYYVYAAVQSHHPQVFSVPSGNFGNLTAGLMAKKTGAPIRKFVAATNVNAVVPEYLATGKLRPRPSIRTISNAMDVGNPSNFTRMRALYDDSVEAMRADVWGVSISEEETRETMRGVWKHHHYFFDPHGAVGYAGLSRYRAAAEGNQAPAIVLATAHPAKFGESTREILGIDVPMPKALGVYLSKKKQAVLIPSDFESLRQILL